MTPYRPDADTINRIGAALIARLAEDVGDGPAALRDAIDSLVTAHADLKICPWDRLLAEYQETPR